MRDLVSRQAAIDALDTAAEHWNIAEPYHEGMRAGYRNAARIVLSLPSAEPRWIPIKTRPLDEEEREYYEQYLGLELDDDEAITFDCPMPCDGQEVWACSKCGNVWQDTCEVDVGIGLEENGDWLDIVAWMPFEKPEPWKGGNDERFNQGYEDAEGRMQGLCDGTKRENV